MTLSPLKIAIVAGEESSDLLGADLAAALHRLSGREVRLVGIGGRHLQEQGLKPLFYGSEIALIGLSAIICDLPRLMRRISETARFIAAEKPDCVVTIDSPDFSLRVAKKIRTLKPSIPIIHYICPSVWAWRPGRAKAMKLHVDEVLCIIPFEPAELSRLGGPKGIYVGHRLTTDPGIRIAAAMQESKRAPAPDGEKTLLLLPGSRRSEVHGLLGAFGGTVSILIACGHKLRLLLPTVPHVAKLVEEGVSNWSQKPEIILDAQHKWQAFGEADAALIASGTVALELALSGVPMMSSYKLDPIMRLVQPLITIWSASLPNLIADRPIVVEAYNQYVRPEWMARHVEWLFADSSLRRWQKDGFAEITKRMFTERPSGELAAEAILSHIHA